MGLCDPVAGRFLVYILICIVGLFLIAEATNSCCPLVFLSAGFDAIIHVSHGGSVQHGSEFPVTEIR